MIITNHFYLLNKIYFIYFTSFLKRIKYIKDEENMIIIPLFTKNINNLIMYIIKNCIL